MFKGFHHLHVIVGDDHVRVLEGSTEICRMHTDNAPFMLLPAGITPIGGEYLQALCLSAFIELENNL